MRIPHRQGLLSYQPGFLQIGQVDTRYVDVVVNPASTTTISFAVASGPKDYVATENGSVTNAWGPFNGTATQYLYWEINQLTGAVERGATTFAPIVAVNAPTGAAVGQMWWDSTANRMNAWTGSRWKTVLRVMAGMLSSGSVLTAMPIGSQVGLNTPGDGGYILTDSYGKVFRDSQGNFLTSDIVVGSRDTGSASSFTGAQILATANESIPRFSAVYFVGKGRIGLATGIPPLNESKSPIGVVTADVPQNDTTSVMTAGQLITNEQWAWADSELGKSVYCLAAGELSTLKPPALKNVRVGVVISNNSILLSFDWETEIITQESGTLAGVFATAPITKSGNPSAPIIGITRSSTTADGFLHKDDFNRIVAVENGLALKSDVGHGHAIGDTSGLQGALDGKAPIVHNHSMDQVAGLDAALAGKVDVIHIHPIADVTGLQNKLDQIDMSLLAKINTPSGISIGNFPAFLAGGQLTDSGYDFSDFALINHVHEMGQVTGLIDALSTKSPIGHTHGIDGEVEGALGDKAPLIHTHPQSDVTNLVLDLAGKAPVNHVHEIADTNGLQGALDNKTDFGHTHTIAEVIQLQDRLDAKAALVHTHAIANVTGLQIALDTKAPLVHIHAIADVTGLQTALDGKISFNNTTEFIPTDPYNPSTKLYVDQRMLGNLANVSTDGATGGQALVFNGTGWVPGTVAGGSGGGVSLLTELADVSAGGASSGQFLMFDGLSWVPALAAGTLSELSDTDVPAPEVDNSLVWDGLKWIAKSMIPEFDFNMLYVSPYPKGKAGDKRGQRAADHIYSYICLRDFVPVELTWESLTYSQQSEITNLFGVERIPVADDVIAFFIAASAGPFFDGPVLTDEQDVRNYFALGVEILIDGSIVVYTPEESVEQILNYIMPDAAALLPPIWRRTAHEPFILPSPNSSEMILDLVDYGSVGDPELNYLDLDPEAITGFSLLGINNTGLNAFADVPTSVDYGLIWDWG